MKVAVTARGNRLDSEIDPRFGRAEIILVVDIETMNISTLDNSTNVNALRGAGIQAASMVSASGAEVLLTGHCGPNAFKTLHAAGIKVVNDISGTVEETVRKFKNGEFTYADSADVDGHW